MAQIKEKTTSIIEYVIDNESGQEVETHRYMTEHILFDAKGNALTEESFMPDGAKGECHAQDFDDQGRLVRTMLYDGEMLAEERRYFYDESGRLVRSLLHYQDGSLSESLYTYDTQGQRTSVRCTDEEGEEEFREEMRYDEQGNLVSRKRLEYEEPVWSRYWTYAEDKMLLNSVEEDHQAGTHLERRFMYNEQGNVIEEKTYRDGKLYSITRQDFDENGHLRETVNESPEQYERLVFSLDAQGNQLYQEAFNRQDELVHKVERSFDANDNPTETKVWMHDIISGITRRYTMLNEYVYHA